MNNEYLDRAKQACPDAKTLILLASKRARQLAEGARPMVRCKDENFIDVALLEVAEGKLSATFTDEIDNDIIHEAEALKAQAAAGTSEKVRNKDME